jgi:hypothetical protein
MQFKVVSDEETLNYDNNIEKQGDSKNDEEIHDMTVFLQQMTLINRRRTKTIAIVRSKYEFKNYLNRCQNQLAKITSKQSKRVS